MSKRKPKNIALMSIINQAGGQSALAGEINADPVVEARNEKTNVTQGHVWAWLFRTGEVPPKYVLPLERISARITNERGGVAVTRSELAPDIYPPAEEAA